MEMSSRSASCPGSFTPRERALGTYWIGGCMALGTGLNAVEKKKENPFFTPAEN
jgi:hypothetical protein